MGYLPIVVAITGFVVLWAIVSRYSINNKRQEAEASASLVFKQAGIRHHLLTQLRQQTSLPTALERIAESTQLQRETRNSTDLLLAAQRVNIALPAWPAIDTMPPSCQETCEQLQIAQRNLQQVYKQFIIRLKQYNELTGKYPTLIVARMTGHYPVDKP